MKGILNKTELLEMMGYEVLISETIGFIIVSLKTDSGNVVSFKVDFDKLVKDFSLEKIVHDMNKIIQGVL